MDSPFLNDDGRPAGRARHRHLPLRVRLHGGAPAGRLAQAAAAGRAPDGRVPGRRRALPAGAAAARSAASRWAGGWRASSPTSSMPPAAIAGLVCLGYPFHPPNKPAQLRTAHLERLACPALIVQGERDPFGGRAEVESLRACQPLSASTGRATATTISVPAAARASPARATSPPPPMRSRRLLREMARLESDAGALSTPSPARAAARGRRCGSMQHGGEDHAGGHRQHPEQRVEAPVLVDEGDERQGRRQHREAHHVAHAVDARPPLPRPPGGRSCSR